MAEEVIKVKYIKLGELASFFYDPVTMVEVRPGQVVKININAVSKKGKIIEALKGGHLDYADASEYKSVNDVEEEEVEEIESEAQITKSDLISEAISEGSELSKTKLKKLSVEQLQDHIEELK